MKLYTRTGDSGETGLLGPERAPKNDIRLTACGDIDELNASLGLILAMRTAPEVGQVLERIQSELFVLGCEISSASETRTSANLPCITAEQVTGLENDIDRLCQGLPELNNFILPGGDANSALLHLARTICRRAERSLVTLSQHYPVSAACGAYLNRLSDLLFAAARYQNHHDGRQDVIWHGGMG